MSAVATYAAVVPVSEFPARARTRWETQYRMAWNQQEHKSEERELLYEISWMEELGLWRWFLRYQRKAKS